MPADQMIATSSSNGHGSYWPWFSVWTSRRPRLICCCVGCVEVGAELRERLQLAELRELELHAAGDLLHRLRLRVRAHARDRDADVDRRADALEEQDDSRKIWPSVIEMTLVGMYADTSPACVSMIGSAVSEPAAELVGQLHRALQQPRVQVEDVAREGLAARRAAQQQRHLAVRVGLLR